VRRVIGGSFLGDREADEHFEGAVENLKDVITGQATVLSLGPLTGDYDDAAITGPALGADNIGFSHQPNMLREPVIFQSESPAPSSGHRMARQRRLVRTG
jgi:hypothetical protein